MQLPTTMLGRALDLMSSDPDRVFSLEELRQFARVALRTRGRLCNQLREHPDIIEFSGCRFQYANSNKE